MARFHKPTKDERIESLSERARSEASRAEALWEALRVVAKLAPYERREVLVEFAERALAEHVECSCGRHASMWCGGTGPKMCETCMSS